jgi:hypothetical protein
MEHYSLSKIQLKKADKITVEFMGDVSGFGASTYRRLFGYSQKAIYTGIVDENGVRFENQNKSSEKFTHHIYNVEYMISNGYLKLLSRESISVQLELFDGDN